MSKSMNNHPTISVELWYQTKMNHGIGTHKLYEKHMSLNDIITKTDNPGAISKNMDQLNGLHHVQIIKDMNGKLLINQLAGYNSRDGLYGYLVQKDDSLERFC